MEISRIEFFCDERNVGKIMRMLAGLALESPKVVPVVNAEAKGGKVGAATNGELISLFTAYLKKHKLTTIKVSGVRDFLHTIGKAPTSAAYLLKKAQEYGLLRKAGKGKDTGYSVLLAGKGRKS